MWRKEIKIRTPFSIFTQKYVLNDLVKATVIKAQMRIELMADRIVINVLIHCATLLGERKKL